jgi:hypothetical protein
MTISKSVRAALAVGLLAWAGCSRHETPTPTPVDLTCLPPDVLFLAGVDTARLREAPLYRLWNDSSLPTGERWLEVRTFLRHIGIDSERELEQVLVAFRHEQEPGEWFAVLKGRFDVPRIEKGLKDPGARMSTESYRSRTLYNLVEVPEVGEFSVTILDPGTVAFGQTGTLRKVIDARERESPSLESRPAFRDLVNGREASAQVWAVLDGRELSRVVAGRRQVLPPGLGEPALKNLATVATARLSLGVTADLDFRLDLESVGEREGRSLADALRGILGFARLGGGERDPDAEAILEAIQVDGEGTRVRVRLGLTGETVRRLEQRFGPPPSAPPASR